MNKLNSLIYTFLILLVLFSCKKRSEDITSDSSAKLDFSRQELFFDTLFTSIGSTTQRLWVYNKNSQAVKISSIRLAGGAGSSYKLIIDGQDAVEKNDYVLNGRDSILLLVRVLIDSQNKSLPYLVEDSIVFFTNGNTQVVNLVAYGQDAFFFTNASIPCNAIWQNTKPYVIRGQASVAAGCTLTIQKGTRVFFHKDATLSVAGTLLVQGEKDSIVKFRHDNLDNFFAELPGQWGGIIFQTGSKNNVISYAEIKNAVNALVLEPEIDADTIAELTLQNSRVYNCEQNALTLQATDFYAINTLVYNCVGYLLYAKGGGNYYFDYCTLANYSYDFFREKPCIRLSNREGQAGDLKIRWRNSILWGDKTEEMEWDTNGVQLFDFSAQQSVFKTTLTISGSNNLVNQNPLFENEILKKYSLKSTSPAANNAISLAGISIDLDGNTRSTVTPDIGCFEQ